MSPGLHIEKQMYNSFSCGMTTKLTSSTLDSIPLYFLHYLNNEPLYSWQFTIQII